MGPGGIGDVTATEKVKPTGKCVPSAGHGGKGGFNRGIIKDYAGQVYGREDNQTLGGSGGNNCINKVKEALLVLMLCAPVFIFTSSFRVPTLWFIDLIVVTCMFNTLF